jgi:arylsulfatase A
MKRLIALTAAVLSFVPGAIAQEGQDTETATPTHATRDEDARLPNIVYILADDLGYRELGSYGQEKIRTPNLDRLAAQGMRFTQHYSGNPVCATSRCVLLTGKHPGHAFIRDNKEVGGWGPEEPEGQWPIPDEEYTIAEMLQEAGYVTGAFGKWGLGGPGSTGQPNNQGFDHFYGYLCQRVAHNYYPTHLWRNHDVDVQHNNRYFKAHQRLKEPLESDQAYYDRYNGGDYAPEEIANELLGFIRKNKDKPFFVYYPTVIPHVALQAPQAFIDQYPREWDDKPYLGNGGYLPHPRPRAAYAAMISYMDDNIGRIMDLLDELGLSDNTIVMFTSDNGTSYAGGVDMKFFNSLGELRGRKGDLYEGGIRVPMIARWPGQIEAGTTTDHLSAFWDVMPTLAELAGVAIPDSTDGVSFAPTLLGEGRQKIAPYLYWEFTGYGGQQVVRLGDWKGIRRNIKKKENLAIELYNLVDDIGEKTDLARERPDIIARMESVMREARTPSALFPMKAIDR